MAKLQRILRARRPGDELRLIEAAGGGDPDASEELARRWWPKAHATATGVLGDPVAAADVAQETVLAALANLESFDLRRPPMPWLTRIATNKALDWLRAESRRPQPTELSPGEGTQAYPGELLEVLEVLAELPPDTRAMLVLRHLGGFSSVEVAEILNTTAGTVRSTMSRATARIERSTEVSR